MNDANNFTFGLCTKGFVCILELLCHGGIRSSINEANFAFGS
jgi:hypothetical protein